MLTYITHLQSAGSQQGLVYHVASVSHADDENVVELLDTVDLGQQLVDHSVVNPRVTSCRPSGFADGVYLVEDDDVETTVRSQL